MAIIYSYPIATPQGADLLIISRTPTDPDEISNYSVSMTSVADYVTGRFINPDATDFKIPVFNQGGTRITGSIMSQDSSPSNGVAGTKITIAGDLTLERDQSDTTLTLISDGSNTTPGGEQHNPSIKFIQDGGSQNAAVGFNIIDDTSGGAGPGLGNRFWIVNSMASTPVGEGGITFGTAQVDGWENAIGRFIIRGDGKGLFGHPDSLYSKTLGSQFEIYDNRDENTTTDPSFSVYSVVDTAAPSGNEGAGGIKQILDVYNNGVFQQQEAMMLIPGTNSSDFAASTPLAFYTNSNMDTVSPSGFAGMIFDSGNWLLDGSGTFTTTDPGYQLKVAGTGLFTGQVTIPATPVAATDAASKAYVDSQNTSQVSGTGTTNTLPIWSDGPNSVLSDSLITQTKIDGGTIFDLNAVTTTNYTPAINTKLLDLNSGSAKKFSITQDGGGGVILPAGGGTTNPGPSFNLGGNAFANGENALSVGAATTAFGNGSFAANFLTLASGGGASAFGLLTEATALASTAFGNKSQSTGNYSIAAGQDSIASGQSSVAIGEKGDAQGKNTFVQGFGGTATANNAVKFGYEGSASGNNSAKFGFESVASGANSLATGTGTTASGLQSIAAGDNNVVSGNNSFVGGKNSTVTGAAAFAFGQANMVSSLTSAAFGQSNTVDGFQSFAAGWNNNTNNYSNQMLLGIGLNSPQNEAVILGRYNDNTDAYNRFQIGNGSSGSNKSNSLSINNAGHIKLPTYGSGTVTGTATRNLSVDADGRIIETTNPTVPDYLSFVCLLSQSGTANPQPNLVLENSLGIPNPFTAFTRVSPGVYNLNATGKFKSLKTIMLAASGAGSSGTSSNVGFSFIDSDNLYITTSGSDNFTKIGIEIRTYN